MEIVDVPLDPRAPCGVPHRFGKPGISEIPLGRACEAVHRHDAAAALAGRAAARDRGDGGS
jgi:hypothetical protein